MFPSLTTAATATTSNSSKAQQKTKTKTAFTSSTIHDTTKPTGGGATKLRITTSAHPPRRTVRINTVISLSGGDSSDDNTNHESARQTPTKLLAEIDTMLRGGVVRGQGDHGHHPKGQHHDGPHHPRIGMLGAQGGKRAAAFRAKNLKGYLGSTAGPSAPPQQQQQQEAKRHGVTWSSSGGSGGDDDDEHNRPIALTRKASSMSQARIEATRRAYKSVLNQVARAQILSEETLALELPGLQDGERPTQFVNDRIRFLKSNPAALRGFDKNCSNLQTQKAKERHDVFLEREAHIQERLTQKAERKRRRILRQLRRAEVYERIRLDSTVSGVTTTTTTTTVNGGGGVVAGPPGSPGSRHQGGGGASRVQGIPLIPVSDADLDEEFSKSKTAVATKSRGGGGRQRRAGSSSGYSSDDHHHHPKPSNNSTAKKTAGFGIADIANLALKAKNHQQQASGGDSKNRLHHHQPKEMEDDDDDEDEEDEDDDEGGEDSAASSVVVLMDFGANDKKKPRSGGGGDGGNSGGGVGMIDLTYSGGGGGNKNHKNNKGKKSCHKDDDSNGGGGVFHQTSTNHHHQQQPHTARNNATTSSTHHPNPPVPAPGTARTQLRGGGHIAVGSQRAGIKESQNITTALYKQHQGLNVSTIAKQHFGGGTSSMHTPAAVADYYFLTDEYQNRLQHLRDDEAKAREHYHALQSHLENAAVRKQLFLETAKRQKEWLKIIILAFSMKKFHKISNTDLIRKRHRVILCFAALIAGRWRWRVRRRQQILLKRLIRNRLPALLEKIRIRKYSKAIDEVHVFLKDIKHVLHFPRAIKRFTNGVKNAQSMIRIHLKSRQLWKAALLAAWEERIRCDIEDYLILTAPANVIASDKTGTFRRRQKHLKDDLLESKSGKMPLPLFMFIPIEFRVAMVNYFTEKWTHESIRILIKEDEERRDNPEWFKEQVQIEEMKKLQATTTTTSTTSGGGSNENGPVGSATNNNKNNNNIPVVIIDPAVATTTTTTTTDGDGATITTNTSFVGKQRGSGGTPRTPATPSAVSVISFTAAAAAAAGGGGDSPASQGGTPAAGHQKKARTSQDVLRVLEQRNRKRSSSDVSVMSNSSNNLRSVSPNPNPNNNSSFGANTSLTLLGVPPAGGRAPFPPTSTLNSSYAYLYGNSGSTVSPEVHERMRRLTHDIEHAKGNRNASSTSNSKYRNSAQVAKDNMVAAGVMSVFNRKRYGGPPGGNSPGRRGTMAGGDEPYTYKPSAFKMFLGKEEIRRLVREVQGGILHHQKQRKDIREEELIASAGINLAELVQKGFPAPGSSSKKDKEKEKAPSSDEGEDNESAEVVVVDFEAEISGLGELNSSDYPAGSDQGTTSLNSTMVEDKHLSIAIPSEQQLPPHQGSGGQLKRVNAIKPPPALVTSTAPLVSAATLDLIGISAWTARDIKETVRALGIPTTLLQGIENNHYSTHFTPAVATALITGVYERNYGASCKAFEGKLLVTKIPRICQYVTTRQVAKFLKQVAKFSGETVYALQSPYDIADNESFAILAAHRAQRGQSFRRHSTMKPPQGPVSPRRAGPAFHNAFTKPEINAQFNPDPEPFLQFPTDEDQFSNFLDSFARREVKRAAKKGVLYHLAMH